MIGSLAEAEAYFSEFIAKANTTTGKDITVDRMWSLLALVNNPQNELNVIHIAGTSGKTSTSYFIASLLGQTGATVGLTVSPHVNSLTERLQINGAPVSDEQFCDLLNQFIEIIGSEPDASYFELLIVFVLWSFVAYGVDYAVVETGLGGLHDSTNVCRLPGKVCVITDIGLDHQHVLGDTIEEIAAQKAGIIHESNHVFMYEQGKGVMNEIQKHVTRNNAHIHIVEANKFATKSQLAKFQQRNWHLAAEVSKYILARDNLKELNHAQLEASQVNVPGRMQKIVHKNKTFVLDGAHNDQKMTAFVDSFVEKYPHQKVPILLGMKEGKEYKRVIEILAPIASEIICTSFNTKQDVPIHSIDPNTLVDECRRLGIVNSFAVDSVKEGLEMLQKTDNKMCIVTGSFYMLGSVTALLK